VPSWNERLTFFSLKLIRDTTLDFFKSRPTGGRSKCCAPYKGENFGNLLRNYLADFAVFISVRSLLGKGLIFPFLRSRTLGNRRGIFPTSVPGQKKISHEKTKPRFARPRACLSVGNFCSFCVLAWRPIRAQSPTHLRHDEALTYELVFPRSGPFTEVLRYQRPRYHVPCKTLLRKADCEDISAFSEFTPFAFPTLTGAAIYPDRESTFLLAEGFLVMGLVAGCFFPRPMPGPGNPQGPWTFYGPRLRGYSLWAGLGLFSGHVRPSQDFCQPAGKVLIRMIKNGAWGMRRAASIFFFAWPLCPWRQIFTNNRFPRDLPGAFPFTGPFALGGNRALFFFTVPGGGRRISRVTRKYFFSLPGTFGGPAFLAVFFSGHS